MPKPLQLGKPTCGEVSFRPDQILAHSCCSGGDEPTGNTSALNLRAGLVHEDEGVQPFPVACHV